MISSVYQSINTRQADNISGLTRSMLIGTVFGAFLLPALFPTWLAISLDKDFMKYRDGFLRQKRNLDDLLVIMLFAVWVAGVTFGYNSSRIPGAIGASLCVGSLAGAFLTLWINQRKFV